MSDIVNIHEAKTHLSRLLERVRRGATITIAKAGTPVAVLIPAARTTPTGRVRETARATAPPVPDRAARVQRFLEQEAWPIIPEGQGGRALTRAEEDAILGYGPTGT